MLNDVRKNSFFATGWRHVLGWVCVGGLFYSYIGYPMMLWTVAVFFPSIVPPSLTTDDMLYELVFALLGLAGLRTVEKIKGVARQ